MPIRSLPFNGDAFEIFERIKHKPRAFFLDSSLSGPQGQFSYLGFSPFKTISGRNFSLLRKAFHAHRQKAKTSFSGGAVGYIDYEGNYYFGLYDALITIDHKNKKLLISAPNKKELNAVQLLLKKPGTEPGFYENRALSPVFKSNFTKAQYVGAVKRALAHIKAGDIYQINLSRRVDVSIKSPIDAARIYQHLRLQSPSSFSAFLHDGKQYVLSSSPERFIKFQNGIAQVQPMKGTRPRGKTKAKDKKLKNDLLKSQKEIAELLMVTDLERNDLGRVCEFGSVKVKAMRTIEEYKTVFQATSTIEGKLAKGRDQFDLLQAVFPSGSVTGCPKIEAMKIIKKIEKSPRGLYTGALGYIGFNGDMDFNVLIRTLFLKKNQITFHVGGGIVADSNPKAEYEETVVKASAMVNALNLSLRGVK